MENLNIPELIPAKTMERLAKVTIGVEYLNSAQTAFESAGIDLESYINLDGLKAKVTEVTKVELG